MNRLRKTVVILLAIALFGCKNSSKETEDNTGTGIKETATEQMSEPAANAQAQASSGFDNLSYDFSKELGQTGQFNNISFKVWTEKSGDLTVINTQPSGYANSNALGVIEINGKVYDVMIDDLDNDGYPELVICTVDNMDHRSVTGYSSNGDKSMSNFYFTPATDNSEINSGYKGADEFTTIEGKLAQRFPLYEGDEATGKHRQILYDLVKGETGKRFKVANASMY